MYQQFSGREKGMGIRKWNLGFDLLVFGALITGCSGAFVATPTATSTPTITLTATATSTATPTFTPTLTPTATATLVPPIPESDMIQIGTHYSYFPGTKDHDQATVEYVDVEGFRDQILTVHTDTQGFPIRIGLYRGKVDLGKWWGDSAPLILETDFVANASAQVYVYPNDTFISIVYITRPIALDTPEWLEISHSFSAENVTVPVDLSQTFVTEYWTFPDFIMKDLVNPLQFNDNMNREYTALKDLLGRDSGALDADGHIHLIVQDHDYCGLAGNPIRMDPVCMGPAELNTGNPGWGAAHELGHDFVGSGSYCCWDGGDSNEGWANFMAFYAYDNKIFINSDYDAAFWDNVWETSTKPTDIFQGLIVRMSHTYSWDLAKVFFRKYLEADPAAWGDVTAKMKQASRYLAEAALESTGDQAEYDYVISFLVSKGFPQP
jgi:hypothetical protein